MKSPIVLKVGRFYLLHVYIMYFEMIKIEGLMIYRYNDFIDCQFHC